MPTYTVLEGVELAGRPLEAVGGGFSRQLLTDLLRGKFGFQGVILSDWGITRDCGENCQAGKTPHTFADIAMPWGVESLTRLQRFAKGVTAGLDQFGGTEESAMLVEAVRTGALTESRLDESVRRIMTQTFALGLAERPFVDEARAAGIVGSAAFRAEAAAAQRRALVVLENRDRLLPLRAGSKAFLHGIDAGAARKAGLTPVDRLEEADVALVRVAAPFEVLHPNHFFGRMQHEGRLGYRDGDKDYDAIVRASARVPTVVTVYLDRPAILTNVRDKARALIGNFGVDDDGLLEVLTGRARADGRLPFELPSSMAEVEAQSPGQPHDTKRPLYPLGAGAQREGSARR
jgi:beta-glucosidase